MVEHENPKAPFPIARLDAFSDGVFAIAITLLVLELAVPESPQLLTALAQEWPRFLAYLVSFLFIGGVWAAHSRLTALIRSADQTLVGLNLLLLLLVSLLPFTTSLLSAHLDDAGERPAVVVFGVNLLLASLMVNVILAHAARMPELTEEGLRPRLREFGRQRRVAVTVQLFATVLGLFFPTLAVIAYLAISLLLLLDPIWRATQQRRRAKRASSGR